MHKLAIAAASFLPLPQDQSKIDFKLWFTDTYVRTKDGWKYAFGQAGTPLKPAP